MPKRKTRVRHSGGHRVAVFALTVAIAVSIGTVATVKSTGGPTPLEAAGIPYPTSAARFVSHKEPRLSGSGNRVVPITLPDGADELAVATITNEGPGKFEVTGESRQGSRPETLVDTSGPYSGTVVFNQARNSVERLHVVATGPWSITLIPVRNVPELSGGALSGTGDWVVVYRGGAGSAAVTDNGPGHFHVTGFGRAGNVVIHEHGPFSGVVRWPAGPSLIAINSGGEWSIHVTAS